MDRRENRRLHVSVGALHIGERLRRPLRRGIEHLPSGNSRREYPIARRRDGVERQARQKQPLPVAVSAAGGARAAHPSPSRHWSRTPITC
jgi:hypothetical protein